MVEDRRSDCRAWPPVATRVSESEQVSDGRVFGALRSGRSNRVRQATDKPREQQRDDDRGDAVLRGHAVVIGTAACVL
jgi:hypothetical protein